MAGCAPSATFGGKVNRRTVHLNLNGGEVGTNGGFLILKAVHDMLALFRKLQMNLSINANPAVPGPAALPHQAMRIRARQRIKQSE